MLCIQTQNASFYFSIDEVPIENWEQLGIKNNIYFQPNYLKVIENNHPKIQFAYIFLKDKNAQFIAFAAIQIIDFYIDDIKNEFETLIKRIKKIARKFHLLKDEKPLQILICGNSFVSGEHGIFIKPNQQKQVLIKQLAKAILHLVNSNTRLKNTIDAFLLKDFINESLYISDGLTDYNYHPFSVDPNMVLKIHENWNTFDDYLAAMKTKFRVKAKRAITLSKPLSIININKANWSDHLAEIKKLYQKVAKNADFNLTNFNTDSYNDLKKAFGENYILKTYWLEDKMVGFISGILNTNSLDAHFVGIDYELNKTYAIYQKMLYDYIAIAINKKLKTINFGRTASEIKSSVGAIPQDLTMYLRHKKNIPNKILKLFLQKVAPTTFQQKFPFKTMYNNEKQ